MIEKGQEVFDIHVSFAAPLSKQLLLFAAYNTRNVNAQAKITLYTTLATKKYTITPMHGFAVLQLNFTISSSSGSFPIVSWVECVSIT